MGKSYPALEERISPDYLEQQKTLHAASRGYGAGGHKWAGLVLSLLADENFSSVLDYGCGQGTLAEKIRERAPGLQVAGYDPARPEFSAEPASADLVVCTDVLEHIEPEKLDAVLRHIIALADRMAFLVISLKPSNKNLPDGRNAHIIVQSAGWWITRLEEHFRIDWRWQEGKRNGKPDTLCLTALKREREA